MLAEMKDFQSQPSTLKSIWKKVKNQVIFAEVLLAGRNPERKRLGTKERTLNQAPQVMRPHQQAVEDDTRLLRNYGPYCVHKHVSRYALQKRLKLRIGSN